MRAFNQPQQPAFSQPQNRNLNDSDLQEEPSKPQVEKKERGFRARLNQHIDEGASKTDKEIEELKKKKDQEKKIEEQKLKQVSPKQAKKDEYLESSDSDEGPSKQYLDQLIKLYKNDPDSITKYQFSLIEHLVGKDSEVKTSAKKQYNDDDFESDY